MIQPKVYYNVSSMLPCALRQARLIDRPLSWKYFPFFFSANSCFTLPVDFQLISTPQSTPSHNDMPMSACKLSFAVIPLNSTHLTYDDDGALLEFHRITPPPWASNLWLLSNSFSFTFLLLTHTSLLPLFELKLLNDGAYWKPLPKLYIEMNRLR